MAKNKKKRVFRFAAVALACTAAFSVSGLASACSKSDNSTDNGDKTTSKEDTQLLKNGNFEFFDVPDKKEDGNAPVYLINSPDNWSHGGSSSYVASGIIGTSQKAWAKITASDLADKLDINNALKSDDENYKTDYVDYNGLKSSDLLYKDTYAALNYEEKDDEDKEDEIDPRTVFIKNPETHYGEIKSDANGLYYTDGAGQRVAVYEDTDENSKTYGDYFLDEEHEKPFSHVLMLHNYATEHNGITQNYSSVEVQLPANTAAEISVWVKTSDLFYNQGSEVTQNRGASIAVSQSVGSSTVDEFAITCINTEKLLGGEAGENNGWVQYTVYVNACDFASSTITLRLGLGDDDEPVEGYAFFDDVTVKKFKNINDEACSYTQNKSKIGDARCDLSSDASEKIFKADEYERFGGDNDNKVVDKRFSENFYYYIDLASTRDYKPVSFGGVENFKAGLTVDTNKYSTAKAYEGKKLNLQVTDPDGKTKLPTDFTALNTSDDLLAYVTAGYNFTSGDTTYYTRLNDALKSAASLPNVSSSTENNVLVLLSAHGAAYTSSFDMSIDGGDDGYKIVSFWVKTSDMKGNTAATVKITEQGNKSNTSSLSIDTTGAVTDIDDENKDIYNGWAQYFFFVKNETDEAAKYTVEFSFGNTTIKDTAASAYGYGWAALANLQYLDVDEDTFAYTGSGENTASITISEDEKKTHSVFDEAYGSQSHEIENGIVNPSNYTGVNGGSLSIVNDGTITVPAPYDETNTNKNAGLINAEHAEKYFGSDWYKVILKSFEVNTSSISAIDSWQEVFGSTSVQPLIIVNDLREKFVTDKTANSDNYKNYYIKNKDGGFDLVKDMDEEPEYDETQTYYSLKQVLNYGFIGSDKTVSSDSYQTVSVKVKVSKGAKAYIYLVKTTAGNELMSFTAPSYSFYYDEDGNVIKELLDDDATIDQKRANVLYTLRDDGLYEDKDGNLRANIYNYTKVYNVNVSYYDKDGNKLTPDDIVDGGDYYNEDKTLANHFLATTDGTKVYEYKDGKYYYIVNRETQTEEVLPFETEHARYDYSETSEDYFVVIDGNDDNVAGKWITVNFVIHAGSEAKSYRLELWSGERDKSETAGNSVGGTVIFDYSYTSISNDDLKNDYESEIISAYQKVLADKNLLSGIASSSENISYYEKLVAEKLTEAELSEVITRLKLDILKSYKAHYYTFSLYDSANFRPFNKNTADENSTGYEYSVSDYEEALAYLSVKDFDEKTDSYTYSVFADYSTTDQSISLEDVADGDDDGDGDEEESGTSIWLLVSSILLVVALLFAMLSIFARDAYKKMRHNKVMGKNNYNHKATNRYMRKLHLQKEEFEEVPAAEAVPEEAPEETTEAKEPEVEQHAEETPAESTEVEQPEAEQPVVEEVKEAEAPAEPAEQPEAEQHAEETENKGDDE